MIVYFFSIIFLFIIIAAGLVIFQIFSLFKSKTPVSYRYFRDMGFDGGAPRADARGTLKPVRQNLVEAERVWRHPRSRTHSSTPLWAWPSAERGELTPLEAFGCHRRRLNIKRAILYDPFG